MRTFRFALLALLVAGAGAISWHFIRARRSAPLNATLARASAKQPPNPAPQVLPPQAASTNAPIEATVANLPAGQSPTHFGPFSISGQNYTVDLETKPVKSNEDSGDTVVAVEIRDAAGAVQFRRTFAAQEEPDYFESWSVSALLLAGTNASGLLLNYDMYSEPSAPEEEPTSWFQVFGVMDGKLVPFGAPLQVQGGLLDEYTAGKVYKAARSLGREADAFEFKLWTGHCRLIYPVRVDWAQGKLSPAQECTKTAGALSAGCEYKVRPEEQLTFTDTTFVRLWPGPDEKSGQPVKTLVKKDSKIDLLIAFVPTQWTDGKTANPSAQSKGPSDEGGFAVPADADLWLKIRIDRVEGWMHSEEDFHALGLPEDE